LLLVSGVGPLQLRQAEVALEFAAAQCRVLVAGVVDGDGAEADGGPGPAQGGQDLLVDAVLPKQPEQVAELPQVLDDGVGAPAPELFLGERFSGGLAGRV
jgi:hypothetical protein